jgi:hypothetical protein
MGIRFMVNDARLAFGQGLFNNDPLEAGQKPAYMCKAIIAPDHPQLTALKALIAKVAQEEWKEKAPAILKAIQAAGKTCLHDGDAKPNWGGFEGNMFLSLRSKIRPTVFDGNRNHVAPDSGIVYSGCYGNFSIEIFAYNKPQKGISAQIRGFQKTRDGDAFAAGSAASEDDFANVGDTENDPTA